jgi:hypothetical protein
MQAAVMIHRMLWWKKVCYPALPCKLAAVVIHRMLWWKGVLSLRCHACSLSVVDPQKCSGGRRGAILRPCKLAAVVIHRMLWWKEGVLSLRCHASSLLL